MSTAWVRPALEALQEAGRRRVLRTSAAAVPGGSGADKRLLVDLRSNDYLGLARHGALRQAATDAIASHGVGATASRLVSGSTDLHARLEEDLAAWKGAEAAIVFPTGFAANTGTIPALVGKGDLVVSDRLNHASIIDGARLSGATLAVYDHADAGHAADLLRAHRKGHGRALLATDGVFSMDGDQAPLAALADACEDHDAMLMVDDAHGTGVIGPAGRGTASLQGVAGRVDVHMGTLSKALGSQGGFIACDAELVAWLQNRARSFVFTTALAPPLAAAAVAAVAIARAGDDLRTRLHSNSRQLAAALQDVGSPVAHHGTPILPVVLGSEARTMAAVDGLEGRGVSVAGIRPPTVPEGTSRLRLTVSAGLTKQQLQIAADALGACL